MLSFLQYILFLRDEHYKVPVAGVAGVGEWINPYLDDLRSTYCSSAYGSFIQEGADKVVELVRKGIDTEGINQEMIPRYDVWEEEAIGSLREYAGRIEEMPEIAFQKAFFWLSVSSWGAIGSQIQKLPGSEQAFRVAGAELTRRSGTRSCPSLALLSLVIESQSYQHLLAHEECLEYRPFPMSVIGEMVRRGRRRVIENSQKDESGGIFIGDPPNGFRDQAHLDAFMIHKEKETIHEFFNFIPLEEVGECPCPVCERHRQEMAVPTQQAGSLAQRLQAQARRRAKR